MAIDLCRGLATDPSFRPWSRCSGTSIDRLSLALKGPEIAFTIEVSYKIILMARQVFCATDVSFESLVTAARPGAKK